MQRVGDCRTQRRPGAAPVTRARPTSTVTLFLAGDVMTGRGIDQLFAVACAPRLFESVCTSALDYVARAERVHGPIVRPVEHAYVWGDALAVLQREAPDVRIVNLETCITTSDDAEPKGINYRMHPANVPVLTSAHLDCCTLANNHVLDWGRRGLVQTLDRLAGAGIQTAGAARHLAAARAPAVIETGDDSRVLVFACAAPDCGIPRAWAAGIGRPGVHLLPALDAPAARSIGSLVRHARAPGDLVVASIHWGPNWGFDLPESHRRFAHTLIDEAGVDIIHGHSSHHPRAIEVYRGRPILYGCGDLLNDYEGIRGYEAFHNDLALMYFVRMDRATRLLTALTMAPMQIRNFRLRHAPPAERTWLLDTMDRECRRFGGRVMLHEDRLVLDWSGTPAGRVT
jgi:poly-gamma-glutamate capsule biosynthesis protein CapA/YwtB (metallophosphatase superfamily)